jgi:hypothetical protein
MIHYNIHDSQLNPVLAHILYFLIQTLGFRGYSDIQCDYCV